MEIQMLNGNICCESLEKSEEVNASGFIVPTDEKSFKRLKVLKSTSELVPEGKEVVVPSFKGTKIKLENKDLEIINIVDIILIKD